MEAFSFEFGLLLCVGCGLVVGTVNTHRGLPPENAVLPSMVVGLFIVMLRHGLI